MTKYKNTYIIQKRDGTTYSTDNAKKLLSGFSIKPEYLAKQKEVVQSSTGVFKFTDDALNPPDGARFGFDDYTEIGRTVNESETTKDGIPVRNMNANVNSCMLMHANPKLTGNVKVVVDSKSNLYIDTFKINDSMSKKKYRHVPISYKDYYGNNIMSVFRDVTSNDFYDIPEKYRRLFTVSHDYTDQYVDTYRYGASTNRDNLYKESLSILAPLKIGKILPDFFVIFRVDGGIPESKSSIETLQYLIKNGEQIKFFDFREGSHLGTYIRNIYNNAKDFVGYIYDSREDQNTNIFNGISLDRGVATSAHESTSFSPDFISDKDPVSEGKNYLKDVTQTNINEYYTRGYERNRLVAPDIVNFEFMFNDDTDQFSINTYFGLYITENDIRSNFYITSTEDGKITFSDDVDGKKRPQFGADVIHAYISDDDFIRTTETNEYDKLKELKNKHGNNVLSLPMKEMDDDMKKYKAYVSFTIHEALNHGEHLRVILNQPDSALDAQTTIYEVVISNNNEYLKNKHHISDDSIVYKEFDYSSGLAENRNVKIHRISVSIGESMEDIQKYLPSYKTKQDEVVDEDTLFLRYELDAIYHAFRSFDDAPFESISSSGGTISIGIYETEDKFSWYEFQRITDKIVYNTRNKEKLDDEDDKEASKVTYFGENVVPLFVLDPLNRNSVLYKIDPEGRFLSYSPFNYEILGPRQMNVVQFVDIKGLNLYELNPIEISDHVLHDQLVIMSENNVTDYEPFKFIHRELTKDEITGEESLIDVPVNINIISSVYRSNLMMVRGYSEEKLSYTNLYEPYMLSESVCGILPIKDFYTAVTNNAKPYDEYDTNFIELNYADKEQSTGNDFDDSYDNLNIYLKERYESGVRNTVDALTTPSIVKWVAAATEASPVYYKENGVYYVAKSGQMDIVTVEQYKYYRWRLYKEGSGLLDTYILTQKREYENTVSEEGFYTKAYNIGAEISNDDSPTLYSTVTNPYKILESVNEGLTIDGETYDCLILGKADAPYNKRIKADGSFDEDSQSSVDYMLTKYRDITAAKRTQEYYSVHMSKYIGEQTLRDALLNGTITIEDIIGVNIPNNVVVDSIDDTTLKFILDGIIREIKIEDSTSISLANYKNFNIYLMKSEYSGNDKDIEVYIDVINKDILLVWYAIQDSVEYVGNDAEDLDIKDVNNNKFREIPTDYTEKDIRIKNGKIYLGDEEITDKRTILYTDNLQVSYHPLGGQDTSIIMYNQYGDTYTDGAGQNVGYTIDPTDYDLNRVCKNNRVIKYVVTDEDTMEGAEDAALAECATYIRETEEGYKNYTQEVKLSISSDEQNVEIPYVKTWFSPKLVDWVIFNDGSEQKGEAKNIYTNVQMLNLKPISMSETLPMYYNKVTTDNSYTSYTTDDYPSYRTSIGRNYQYKTLMNCFSRKFNILTKAGSSTDKNTYVGGFTTGKLIKTYLNSLALNTRKNDISEINITIWNGVSNRGGKIYFNITSALINNIMSMSGYSRSWSYYKDSRYADMKKFIINSILPYLTIDNKSELNVYFQKGVRTIGSATKPPRAEKIDNVTREVIRQNGDYYVVLTPDRHKIGTYYITFKVTQ